MPPMNDDSFPPRAQSGRCENVRRQLGGRTSPTFRPGRLSTGQASRPRPTYICCMPGFTRATTAGGSCTVVSSVVRVPMSTTLRVSFWSWTRKPIMGWSSRGTTLVRTRRAPREAGRTSSPTCLVAPSFSTPRFSFAPTSRRRRSRGRSPSQTRSRQLLVAHLVA